MARLLFLLGVCVAASAFARDEVPEALRPYGKTGGTVVVALSPTCPCSKSHEPALAELARQFPTFGFVGVRADESVAEQHFAAAKLPFPVVAKKGVASTLGAMKTPHVFVYDGAGLLRYRGGVDDSHDAARAKKHYLAETLSALKAGTAPPVAETRPLGCRVDWD